MSSYLCEPAYDKWMDFHIFYVNILIYFYMVTVKYLNVLRYVAGHNSQNENVRNIITFV